MNNNVGVWIDHKNAIVIRITDTVEETHSIISGMERHGTHMGGKPDDRLENSFANHLKEYFTQVMSFLRETDSILIFGPGEAKGEFEKYLVAKSFRVRIVDVEATDKMTKPQIAAKVRERFLNSNT